MVLGRRAGLGMNRGQLRPFGNWVIQDAPPAHPSGAVFGTRSKVSTPIPARYQARAFWSFSGKNPGSRPHLITISRSCTTIWFDRPARNREDEGHPYVLSSFVSDLGAVLSVQRLRTLQNEAQRRQALRRLTLNAFGQVLQLPGPARTENVSEIQAARWCTNRCALRHAPDVATMLDLAVEEEKTRTMLCPQCTSTPAGPHGDHAFLAELRVRSAPGSRRPIPRRRLRPARLGLIPPSRPAPPCGAPGRRAPDRRRPRSPRTP